MAKCNTEAKELVVDWTKIVELSKEFADADFKAIADKHVYFGPGICVDPTPAACVTASFKDISYEDNICACSRLEDDVRSKLEEQDAAISKLRIELENMAARKDAEADKLRRHIEYMADAKSAHLGRIKKLEADIAVLKAKIEYCKKNGIWAEMPDDDEERLHWLDGLELDNEDKE